MSEHKKKVVAEVITVAVTVVKQIITVITKIAGVLLLTDLPSVPQSIHTGTLTSYNYYSGKGPNE